MGARQGEPDGLRAVFLHPIVEWRKTVSVISESHDVNGKNGMNQTWTTLGVVRQWGLADRCGAFHRTYRPFCNGISGSVPGNNDAGNGNGRKGEGYGAYRLPLRLCKCCGRSRRLPGCWMTGGQSFRLMCWCRRLPICCQSGRHQSTNPHRSCRDSSPYPN